MKVISSAKRFKTGFRNLWQKSLCLLLLLCLVAILPSCDRGGNAPRTMIIAVDGVDWSIIRPLLAEGRLPHIQSLLVDGSHGPLQSIQPLTTPATWTTIATGSEPDQHGIYDHFTIDPETNQPHLATTNYRLRPAFWNLVSNYGVSVAIIGWPNSWPAEAVNGLIVTDRMIGSDWFGLTPPSSGLVYPSPREQSIRDLIGDPALVSFEQAKQFIDLAESEYTAFGEPDLGDPLCRFRIIYQAMRTAVDITKQAINDDDPDLVAVRLDGLDAAQYLFTRHMMPALPESIESEIDRYQNTVLAFYEYFDALLGELLSLTDRETSVLLVSNTGCRTGERRPVLRREYVGIVPASLFRRPEGVLLMKGPNIKSASAAEEQEHIFNDAHLADIAPTILALAGLPVPETMNGQAITDLFEGEPPLFEIDPDRSSPETYLNQPTVISSLPKADEELMDRLILLGQIGSKDSQDLYRHIRYHEVNYHISKDNQDTAIQILSRLCKNNPDSIDPFARLARLYMSNKQWSNARHTMAQALVIDPTNIDIQMNMAFVYREMNNYVKAIEVLQRASDQHPEHVGVHVNIGMLYKDMKQYSLAKKSVREALAKNPDHHGANVQMALLYEKEEEYEDALKHWQAAVGIRPNDQMSRQHIESLHRRGYGDQESK